MQDGISAVEHSVGEFGHVFGSREDSGVSGNAAQYGSVFVVDFALDDPIAESLIIHGRRNVRANFGRRIEGGATHPQRAKNFALAEAVKRFAGDALERSAQDDEADIAVFGAGAGIGGQKACESSAPKIISGVSFQE